MYKNKLKVPVKKSKAKSEKAKSLKRNTNLRSYFGTIGENYEFHPYSDQVPTIMIHTPYRKQNPI